jgi:uncharacterized protein (DUF4415 family)
MENENDIKRFSIAELEGLRARGDSKTDLARVRAKSEAELDRDIANDHDFRDIPEEWNVAAEALMPSSKKLVSLRLDPEVINWFKEQGPGYQTRMNAVLRAFVDRNGKKRSSSPGRR